MIVPTLLGLLATLHRTREAENSPAVSRRWILFLYILPALVLASGSVLFMVTDLDLAVARPFYHAPGDKWPAGDGFIWQGIYHFGVFPGFLVAVGAFCLLMLGIGRPRLSRYRKISAYLVLVLAIGAGLVTNALLKDHWGRPRPREVIEFGGEHRFEPLMTIDPSSPGKSFPCGHATMGFYFFAPGLVFLALGRRRTGGLVLLGAVVFGAALGMARTTQGGHFASDTLWAAGVMWFVSAGLFHAFRLHCAPFHEPEEGAATRVPRWIPALTATGLVLLIGAVSLAWPYSDATTKVLGPPGVLLPDTITLNLDLEGALEIEPGGTLTYSCRSQGFGFPKSNLHHMRDRNGPSHEIAHRRKGFFTELDVRTRLTLPPNRVYHIALGPRVTSVRLDAPAEPDPRRFAHVRLSRFAATRLRGVGGKDVEQDLLGRIVRVFSF